MLTRILCFLSSGGMLSKEEQRRATDICITLISALEQWAPKHVVNLKDDVSLRTGPASHARAVLQLLARLTKNHGLAQQASTNIVDSISTIVSAV